MNKNKKRKAESEGKKKKTSSSPGSLIYFIPGFHWFSSLSLLLGSIAYWWWCPFAWCAFSILHSHSLETSAPGKNDSRRTWAFERSRHKRKTFEEIHSLSSIHQKFVASAYVASRHQRSTVLEVFFIPLFVSLFKRRRRRWFYPSGLAMENDAETDANILILFSCHHFGWMKRWKKKYESSPQQRHQPRLASDHRSTLSSTYYTDTWSNWSPLLFSSLHLKHSIIQMVSTLRLGLWLFLIKLSCSKLSISSQRDFLINHWADFDEIWLKSLCFSA